jgi:hypothetical protein
MSYVTTLPELLTASAGRLQVIGSAVSAANVTAAFPTTGVVPAAADEVSAMTAVRFGAYGQTYQAISAEASVIHEQFVSALGASANSYAATEVANMRNLGLTSILPSGAPAQPAAGYSVPAYGGRGYYGGGRGYYGGGGYRGESGGYRGYYGGGHLATNNLVASQAGGVPMTGGGGAEPVHEAPAAPAQPAEAHRPAPAEAHPAEAHRPAPAEAHPAGAHRPAPAAPAHEMPVHQVPAASAHEMPVNQVVTREIVHPVPANEVPVQQVPAYSPIYGSADALGSQ